ncbi:MAG: peptidoglycan DD-metalloendopeptidase family protein [Myxococcaceae bacterium]|nr:peptidoglycan DD-metalloendopeptidase family protein [Myxococcaceae bacterium]
MQAVPVVHVPFGCGLSFEVSQAHNVGSHLDNDEWAWDFRMPEGVPIVAARAGVVRMARGDSTRGGCDPKFAADANYVVIDHGDGTEAQYLHFSSVVVQAGQKVNAGELLGYSGKTGWACGSHLHFKIAKHVHDGWNNPSIPAAIEGYGDPQVATLVRAPTCPKPAPDVIQADAHPAQDVVAPKPATAAVVQGAPTTQAIQAAHQADRTVLPASGPAHAAGNEATAAPTSTDVAPDGTAGYTAGANAAK